MCSKESHKKLISRTKKWQPIFFINQLLTNLKDCDSCVYCKKCDDVIYFNSEAIRKEEKKK